MSGLSLVLFWTEYFLGLNEIALCEGKDSFPKLHVQGFLVRHTVISVDCSYVTHITQGI